MIKKLYNKHKLLGLSFLMLASVALLLWCSLDIFKVMFNALFSNPLSSLLAGVGFGGAALFVESLIKSYLRHSRFEKGYEHLIMGCDHFDRFDPLVYSHSGDCWSQLYSKLKYVTPLKRDKYYKGAYNYIWDEYDKLAFDLSYVVWHMSLEMDYLNAISSWNTIERSGIKMLYENELTEQDAVVMKRWKFFLEKMKDGDAKDELAEKYKARFEPKAKSVTKELSAPVEPEIEIPNHIDNDLIEEVLRK